MRYFDGVKFGWGDHVPRCSVWIDSTFPDFYALNFAAAGTIYGEDAGGARHRWTTPVAWWTQPGRHYAYGCGRGETWDHFYITLRGPRIRAIFTQGLLPPGRAWHAVVHRPDEMRLQFLELLELVRLGAGAYPRAVHLLEGLFLLLHSDPRDVADPTDSRTRRLRLLAEQIRQSPILPWDMNREAAKLGVSAVHFRRLFRQEFGEPGHRYLLHARIDHAARLLRLTERPVKEVAEACGVPDVFYFTRLFSERMGTSPARYRLHAGLVRQPATARERASRNRDRKDKIVLPRSYL
jgi:AraC-like DNA-binding protein